MDTTRPRRRFAPPLDAPRRRRSVQRAARWLRSRADAEDLTHDVWLRLATRAAPDAAGDGAAADGGPASPDAWWTTALRNASIDRLRRCAIERRVHERAVNGEVDHRPDASAATPPDDVLDRGQRLDRLLHRLVATSSPAIVAMVVLRVVFELEVGELAAETSMTEAACRQAVHRALVRARTSPDREPTHDDEAVLTLCRNAIGTASADALRALLPHSPRAAQVTSPTRSRPTARAIAPAPARRADPGLSGASRAQTTLALVGGRYVLALVLDGVVLCALPVGPCEDLVPESVA